MTWKGSLTVAALAPAALQAQSADSVANRRQAVESGLLPQIVTENEQGYALRERMVAHGVPGLSFGHGGNSPGFAGFFVLYPARGDGVVVMANATSAGPLLMGAGGRERIRLARGLRSATHAGFLRLGPARPVVARTDPAGGHRGLAVVSSSTLTRAVSLGLA